MQHCMAIRAYRNKAIFRFYFIVFPIPCRNGNNVVYMNKSISQFSIHFAKVHPTNLAYTSVFFNTFFTSNRIAFVSID